VVESLHCTNCGAPLRLTVGQTLVACAFCNSTLRVAAGGIGQPAVSRMEAVPPEVVDEVKRLLVLGNLPKAVAYYAQATGLTEAEATTAVRSLQGTLGYAPPLNWFGMVLLVVHSLIGAAGLVLGWQQIAAGRGLLGIVLLVVGVGWAGLNWLVLGRGLRSFWLTYRGTPAEATILQRWTIRTVKAQGEPQPVALVRFLLQVRPPGRPPFEAEANGLVRERSQPRLQPGCAVRVRLDPAAGGKLVLLGPLEQGA
jgi:hypothetical protein